jgi:hypothetical protein
MDDQYIVRITDPGTGHTKHYGPFGSKSAAETYVAFYPPGIATVWPLYQVGKDG